ncbi:antirepressor [Paenibacillus terrae]|uniref:Antirepressor n=1 Tax=Paenibacillus terrae TaxID=159743 RepID=A0A0D7WTI5_9BACL|nr:antirepressor [Paenibacillus terrae]
MRTETWLGHSIRFIEKVPGEWWAIAADIAEALGYERGRDMLRKLKSTQKGAHLMSTLGGRQEVSIISETGIYKVIMRSRRKEAEEFEDWVLETIRTLRQSTGLEGFQIFRMLDKDHQKEAMQKLRSSLKKPVRVDFIKANTIANKAVSSKYGHPKMIKKDRMTPDMLVSRQEILEDTVDLMGTKERFGLDIAVSQTIYDKHIH